MARILSVWLPDWPILRLRRHGASSYKPLATVDSQAGQRILAAVCPLAAGMGLRPDQALAVARSLAPDMLAVPADPAADLAGLAAIAGWCARYTPLTAIAPPDGLWLDIEGCAHLWQNEAGLAADLLARMMRNGLPARLAIASSAGAAWALARHGTDQACQLLPAGQEADALANLPISLLRLERRVVLGLRRVGLTSIGALARLPRAELAARFGTAPVQRLEQAFGLRAEAISWAHRQ